jgi:pyruvate dehydrogenase E1 component beta subunit
MESEVMYADKAMIPEDEYLLPIGTANITKEGNSVTLVSFGKMMKIVDQAAIELEKEGISAEVIDLRTVRPLDYATIVNSVKKTNRLVIVEEAWPMASISTDIAYHVQKNAFDYLDAPVARVNSMDVPLAYAPTLIEASLPNVKRTIEAVKSVMYV